MIQYTERYTIMISEKQKHYLSVLHEKYKINSSEFIRQAIDEKMQRDVKNIRIKFKKDNSVKLPF
jgi:hypothetical protein